MSYLKVEFLILLTWDGVNSNEFFDLYRTDHIYTLQEGMEG